MLKKKISKEYAEFDLLKLFGPLPNPNKSKEDRENFKVLVRGIKVNYCKKCPEYTLSTSQLSDIKKFRPDKAQKEIKSAFF